jgi:Predicted nucleic acid-binding protein, contains PIN domain
MKDENIKAVVDCSYLIEAFESPKSERFNWIFESESRNELCFALPELLYYEIGNVMLSKCKKHIFDTMAARESLSFLSFAHKKEVDFIKVFDLAQKHNLTFYDASYLQLAIDLKVPLATYDQQLIEAAKAEKVKLVA